MPDTAPPFITDLTGKTYPDETSIPAATVVIFRRAPGGGPPQLLMAQRGAAMRFAGGATVFPGGRIDASDRDLARALAASVDIGPAGTGPADTDPADDTLDDSAARIAAIRETLEETGLAIGLDRPVSAAEAEQARRLLLNEGGLAPVLAAMGWRLAPETLVPFARWCPRWEKAFDTRFYLADLGTGAVDISVDGTEFTHMFWISAADALAKADAGELSAIFPTRRNLERLAQFASFAEAQAHAESFPIHTITPHIEERDGEQWLIIPEGVGYPVLGQPLDTVRRG